MDAVTVPDRLCSDHGPDVAEGSLGNTTVPVPLPRFTAPLLVGALPFKSQLNCPVAVIVYVPPAPPLTSVPLMVSFVCVQLPTMQGAQLSGVEAGEGPPLTFTSALAETS